MSTALGAAATGTKGGAPGATVAVAFSGGRDSLALLHATAHAARSLSLQVVALHVHHGLVAQADDWLKSAERTCARWRRRGLPIRLQWHRLSGRPGAGDSIEAWARCQRYAALAAMARGQGASLLLLAQHRRDQAETVLLQALRGAGPRGLAAMPALVEREGLIWARPWLDWPREAIDGYVLRHRLRPIEDPSNSDERLARNRLRIKVWPGLIGAFDDSEIALAAVAKRAHEADCALTELAAMDLNASTDGAALRIPEWSLLSSARRANALRAWLAVQSGRGATETLVQRLLRELPGASVGRWPLTAGMALSLFRGRLARIATAAAVIGERKVVDLSRPGTVVVPSWAGAFEVRSAKQHGVAAELLTQPRLEPRHGGERFQCQPKGLARSLKKQFQGAGVAAAERSGPLLWSGDRLLFVPGLGLDARCWAADGEPQLQLFWRPDSAVGRSFPARRDNL